MSANQIYIGGYSEQIFRLKIEGTAVPLTGLAVEVKYYHAGALVTELGTGGVITANESFTSILPVNGVNADFANGIVVIPLPSAQTINLEGRLNSDLKPSVEVTLAGGEPITFRDKGWSARICLGHDTLGQ